MYVKDSSGNYVMDGDKPLSVSPTFRTPEYEVPRTSTRKTQKNKIYTDEELMENYERFVKFRDAVREIGFLPEDANGTSEFSLDPKRNPKATRTASFIIDAFVRLENEEAEERRERNVRGGFSPVFTRTPIVLFDVHLQTPSLHGFTPSGSRVEARAFAEFFARRGVAFDNKTSVQNLKYSDGLKVLKIIKSQVAAEFAERDISVNADSLVRYMALQRFCEKGFAVRNTRDNTEMLDFIFELVRLDVPLYASMLALSERANPNFKKTNTLAYDAESLEMVKDIPETYVRHILLS